MAKITFDKKNAILQAGTFDLGSNQKTCDLFYPFIEDCLKYIKTYASSEWDKGDSEDGLLTMNRGIQAVIRVIDDIVLHLISTSHMNPKAQTAEETFSQVRFYLDPLIDYLNNASAEQRKDLRGYFGSGANPRFWRAYQKAISDGRKDFHPAGLDEFWLNETKQFNKESVQYIHEIEVTAKGLIRSKLIDYYGENWEIKALPRNIYSTAKQKADDQNYENVKSGQSASDVTIWDCVTLAECKTIVISGSHWTEIFESVLTIPSQAKISGGKAAKTEWLARLTAISNKLMKSSYSVSKDEFDYIKLIHDWIVQ